MSPASRRRLTRAVRVSVVYAVVAALLWRGADGVAATFILPPLFGVLARALLIIGWPVAAVVAWNADRVGRSGTYRSGGQ